MAGISTGTTTVFREQARTAIALRRLNGDASFGPGLVESFLCGTENQVEIRRTGPLTDSSICLITVMPGQPIFDGGVNVLGTSIFIEWSQVDAFVAFSNLVDRDGVTEGCIWTVVGHVVFSSKWFDGARELFSECGLTRNGRMVVAHGRAWEQWVIAG
ncbi:MAG: hypothetical protein ACKOCK_00205 [Chloroflexota bacterium]